MGYVSAGMVSPEPGPESEAATEATLGVAHLRESELYALAFQSISDGLIVTDSAGRILLFNAEAERLLGQSLGGSSVRSWSELADAFLPEGTTAWQSDQDPLAWALSGREAREFEQLVRSSSYQDDVFMIVTSRALCDSAGHVSAALLVLRDVTAQECAQRSLERANAELRRGQAQQAELSALLVHDLKSPLQSIIMNTRYLIAGETQSDAEHDCLKDVLSAADTLHRMVLDLLDVSVSEDSQLSADRRELDVLELLEHVRASMALRAVDQHQSIVTSVLLEQQTIHADRELLRRALSNLVDNCIKYGPVGGRIGIEARSVPGGIEFRVHDQGPGIPAAKRQKIFEKYTRVDPDSSALRAGSRGLGLRFCWVAVEAHGGRIWVEDNLPLGASFCIYLPETV
ncbi:MAG TPA: HAMP domain-containing sensor histidine kinase [Polyangiaceae bacterium]